MGDFPRLVNPSDNSTITINNSTFSIGRSLTCDHIIQSLDVSRFHCVIKKNDNKWILYDRSSNGTIVNSKLYKFNESIDLKNGDVIKLGPGNLSFIFADLKATQRTEDNENPTHKTSNPTCSTSSEFPNDDLLIEEAAALLSDSLEDGMEECSSSNFLTQKNSQNDTDVQIIDDPQKTQPEQANLKTEGSESTPSKGQKSNALNSGPNLDIMENELTCSICSELFIKAVTLNCSHTFCKYCIDEWRRNKSNCPICRKPIATVAPTLVLDNFIEKIIETQKEETKAIRKEIIKQREEMSVNTASSSNVAKSSRRDDTATYSYDEDDEIVVDGSDTTYSSEDDHDYDYDRHYSSRRQPYYGGYGKCFICREHGHWANSCPFKRL